MADESARDRERPGGADDRRHVRLSDETLMAAEAEAIAWLDAEAEELRRWREDPAAAQAAGVLMPWADMQATFGSPAEAEASEEGEREGVS